MKTDIVKVSTAEDFTPAVNINANTKEIKNLVTDYSDDSSAVNVGFLTNKVQEVVVDVNDKIVNVKKNVVFKNESQVIVDDVSTGVDIPLTAILTDDRIITHDVDYLQFINTGLYKITFSTVTEGDYKNGRIQFIMVAEDGTETIFRYLNLGENSSDISFPSVNALDKFKIKAIIDETGQSYKCDFKFEIESLFIPTVEAIEEVPIVENPDI